MSEQTLKEEFLYLIREIASSPETNQRILSSKLGISLGKTNYLLKELIRKGFIKARNFTKNPQKLHKISYILTKEGFEHRIKLTYHFLQRKEQEYNHIKNEWEHIANNLIQNNPNGDKI